MATTKQLMDPDYIPYEGELRWLFKDRGSRKLQQYQSGRGWKNVARIDESDIPTGGKTPNACNA